MICYAEQDKQLRPAEGKSGAIPVCVATSAGLFIGDKMRKIPLTQNQFALVDDRDFEELSKYKWFAIKAEGQIGWYAGRQITISPNKQKTIRMHQQILGFKKGDHQNRNGLDNRRQNLRLCTHQQNCVNRGKRQNAKCKYKGVSCRKSRPSKWRARITVNQKTIMLGCYKSEIEAARAYDRAAKKYFGEFACLNFGDV